MNEAIDQWFRPGPSRDTFAKWPKPCELVINIDPDEYPTQTTCDRCGWREYEHPAPRSLLATKDPNPAK